MSSPRSPPAGVSSAHASSSRIVKTEEADSSSLDIAGILRHRDSGRYGIRDVPNVKEELDDAKGADLDHERNVDILKRHIMALRRECDSLTRERDAALRASVAESGNLAASRTDGDTLKRERDAALRESAKYKTEKAILEALVKLHKSSKDDIEARIERYKAEKHDIEAHVRQYNPEVIERQEELLVNPELQRGSQMNLPNPPLPLDSSNGPMMRMRNGLYCLGVRRGPPSHILDGFARFDQFRQWLQRRPVLSSGQKRAPSGKSAVFKGTHLPPLPMAASRSCKAPPLFLGQLHDWSTKAKQLGVLLCPEYVYGPTGPYTQPVWSRADQWRACGEEEREVFYCWGGEVHYAGTYVCHSGPGSLKVHHISKFNSMGTADIVSRLGPVTHLAGVQTEHTAILDLYREGTLTVHVLGLERIGFNDTLYSYLHVVYEQENNAAREAETRKQAQKQAKKQTKKQKKAARAAALAAQQPYPQLPLAPPPVLQPPLVPPTFGFNFGLPFPPAPMNQSFDGFQSSQASLHGLDARNGFVARPPPPARRVPSPPSPLRRAPSELEYAKEEPKADAVHVKREREDDGYLLDDERKYKAAKLEDAEDEQRVDDKLRVRTEESGETYGKSGTYNWNEDVYVEPYLGFKDEESD